METSQQIIPLGRNLLHQPSWSNCSTASVTERGLLVSETAKYQVQAFKHSNLYSDSKFRIALPSRRWSIYSMERDVLATLPMTAASFILATCMIVIFAIFLNARLVWRTQVSDCHQYLWGMTLIPYVRCEWHVWCWNLYKQCFFQWDLTYTCVSSYHYTNYIESDDYVKNHHIHSRKHAMFLSHVVVGNSQKLYQVSHGRVSPDYGYDSVSWIYQILETLKTAWPRFLLKQVEAVTRQHGGSVNYAETVVYHESAILPAVVIVYTRVTVWL